MKRVSSAVRMVYTWIAYETFTDSAHPLLDVPEDNTGREACRISENAEVVSHYAYHTYVAYATLADSAIIH